MLLKKEISDKVCQYNHELEPVFYDTNLKNIKTGDKLEVICPARRDGILGYATIVKENKNFMVEFESNDKDIINIYENPDIMLMYSKEDLTPSAVILTESFLTKQQEA